MPILKKGEIKVRATAYGTEVKSTGYIFYSYDKNSSALFFQFRNQNGETTDIANAKIRLLLIKNDDEDKEFIPSQEDFEIISKPGGKAKFVLPEMLLAYQGKVTGYIYLDFEDGSQTDEGQFTFRIRRSMITHVLPAMGDKYVRDFEDVKERVEQAGDSATKDIEKAKDDAESQIGDYVGEVESAKDSAVEDIDKALPEIVESAKQDISSGASDVQSKADQAKKDMQNNVDAVKSDYEAWKADQKKENEDFQNEYKQHWQNFKDTQVNKQTEFEDSTNKQLKGITEDVNKAEDKVADLEKNLDVEQKNYFSVTAWKNKDDSVTVSGSIPAIKINLEGNTKYTLSTNVPKSGKNDDVFFATGDKHTVNTTHDGVAIDEPRTITTNDDGVAIVAIRGKDMTSGDWWIMLNKGETSARWVPNANDLVTKSELEKIKQAITNLGGSI